MKSNPDISIVLGSLNRKALLKQTIQSIRQNQFSGEREIIVVDGGSKDGTCDWLAKQHDILTLVQPNFRVEQPDGKKRRVHSWGEFINMGFRQARARWILMVSDDLLLCHGAMQKGMHQLQELQKQGIKVGGGAIFWREYPRDKFYHVKRLPGNFVHVNHGFFWKDALETVGYADEESFEFYGADGDLTMRLNLAGWRTVPLDCCFAEHLNHRVRWQNIVRRKRSQGLDHDMRVFDMKYKYVGESSSPIQKSWTDPDKTAHLFWRSGFRACLEGALYRFVHRLRSASLREKLD